MVKTIARHLLIDQEKSLLPFLLLPVKGMPFNQLFLSTPMYQNQNLPTSTALCPSLTPAGTSCFAKYQLQPLHTIVSKV